jgi:ATP-dependent DNA helicase DinG
MARCLDDNDVYIVESGTGTGKTFAYLVPAVLSGKRVIVSTGTKPLQDQLYHRDLPAVLGALGTTARIALLKGRANYLCLHRLAGATQQKDIVPDVRTSELLQVSEWARATTSGDLAELTTIAEDSPVRGVVTSTNDNCLGAKCPQYDDCHVNRARRAALGADILVINHHLFCADLVLREDGFGQLLPGADAVIFDEAHQLAEVATNFLGVALSSNQIRELCRDVALEEQREQSQVRGLLDAERIVASTLEKLIRSVATTIDRQAWDTVGNNADAVDSIEQLLVSVSDLSDLLELAAPAGEGLTRCWQRALTFAERLGRFSETPDPRYVRWLETGRQWFRFHETPLQLGDSLGPCLRDQNKAWFYTSATLSVKEDFTFFRSQLGVEAAECLSLDSPFDYAAQARLYIPSGLPDPRQRGYVSEVVASALPILKIVSGRTFFLFTSHNALREAHEILTATTSYNLLVQGQMPRTELLQRFRSTPRAVLLGTSSFWEGVDVRGPALSCVIIDKLPFASPSDPVLRARLGAIESDGGRPFVDYQLPQAVIALKQGVGRLIRDNDDVGILMLCDPRLLGKGYGRVFLNSIPNIPLTRDIDEVHRFFEQKQVIPA